MAEFQNIKSGFNRRKEDLNKKLRAPAVATTRRGAPPKRGVNRPVVGKIIHSYVLTYFHMPINICLQTNKPRYKSG